MARSQPKLFPDDNPVAQRQPRTDRLVLESLLKEAAGYPWVKELAEHAHPILLKWADLESSGRLTQLTETQLQGDFLGEVFSQALGYARAVDNAEAWQLEQHHAIGDAHVIGDQFAQAIGYHLGSKNNT